MSCPMFLDDQNLLEEYGTGDERNNGLVNDQIPILDQYSAQPEHGANTFPLPALANHAHFQPVNTQINHNQSVQPDAYPLQFGTATSYAMKHGLVNVQLPHRLDQPQDFFIGCGTGDELNNGWVNDQIPILDQYSAQPEEHGANTFRPPAPADHAHFQPVNTQINHNQSVQPDAYPLPFGTATSYAMEHRLVNNVQLPHQWDQPQGAIYRVNPSISAQMNLPPVAIPGSSQSSNISNADHEKRLRKQESDRKSRAKKEQMRRENEERLVKVTKENNELRKYNATLKDGEVEMKRTLKNFEQKVSYFEKEVRHLNNKLKGQNTKVDVLSEKLVASSETTVLVEENKRLKRKNELLMTRLNNPDIMQTVELVEEIEKWKLKAKRLQIINEALCDKMNNDEH